MVSSITLAFTEAGDMGFANWITNDVRGISRVAYDVTSKPPGIIEEESGSCRLVNPRSSAGYSISLLT